MPLTTFTYRGTAYRQALDPDAPWLVSLVVQAEELYRWAGVPRKSDSALVGFQRPEDEVRVRNTQKYFSRFAINQSPTSLVIGIHRYHAESSKVELKLHGDTNANVLPCELEVTINTDETVDQVVARLTESISKRLEENSQEGFSDVVEGDAPDTAEDSLEGSDSEDFGSDNEIELGRSLLVDLMERLKDPSWVASNKEAIIDLAKPATVIDGQHRMLGAKLCERGIPFSVIAIHNCTWAEQVFQFTVVNYTAKGIPDQFITANAALSLTAEELAELEDRLDQAGVKVVEYELMRTINFDQESPFHDLVNLTEKAKSDLIGYKTMVKLGKAWYSGKEDAVQGIVRNLFPEVKGTGTKSRREKLERWKQSVWSVFFKDFWNVVHDHVKTEWIKEKDLWKVGDSNLMIAATLLCLQEQFFVNLSQQDEDFFEIKDASNSTEEMRLKIKKRARTFIGYFDEEVFSAPWKVKSINTGPGKLMLNQLFRDIVQSKGTHHFKKSQLFTG